MARRWRSSRALSPAQAARGPRRCAATLLMSSANLLPKPRSSRAYPGPKEPGWVPIQYVTSARHEARPDQTVRQEVRQPSGVVDVGLAAGHVLYVRRIRNQVRFASMSRLSAGMARRSPLLLTTAACGGLRSTPDCRPRRALLHLSYSYAPPYGPALLVTQCLPPYRFAC
jgi:hypothetical protein